jgi:hypothetical protein
MISASSSTRKLAGVIVGDFFDRALGFLKSRRSSESLVVIV